MNASQSPRISIQRAMIVSAALHFLAAALLIAAPRPNDRSLGDTRGATGEAVRVSTVTIAFRPRPALAKPLPHAARLQAPHAVSTRPPQRLATAIAVPKLVADTNARATTKRAIVERIAPGGKHATGPAALQRSARDAAEAASGTTVDPSDVAGAPTPTPPPAEVTKIATASTPVPTAAPETVANAANPAQIEAASGGWGQSAKPLIEDDDELAKLRASAHATGRVSIEVDEKGNATRVTLPASLASELRAELEKEFLALHYVPAECNGLRCTGTLQVTL